MDRQMLYNDYKIYLYYSDNDKDLDNIKNQTSRRRTCCILLMSTILLSGISYFLGASICQLSDIC